MCIVSSTPLCELIIINISPEHTLSLLYTAQQAPQSSFQATPSPFSSPAPVASLPASQPTGRQSSLHSFFAIPSAPRQTSPSSIFSNSSSTTPLTSSANKQFFEATTCEDCDASLNPENGDGMDVDMMDIDTNGGSGHACTNCGKNVCHSCAVSNLGADRKCLMCAGKKKQVWVGGLGWMNAD